MVADAAIIRLEQLEQELARLRAYFERERLSEDPLETRLIRELRLRWRPLGELPDPLRGRIIAVDSGVVGKVYADGKALFLLRAAAVDNEGRMLVRDEVLFDAGTRPAALRRVARLAAERLEYRVVLELMAEGDAPSVILIDGSLYARLSRLPRELPTELHPTMILDTIELLLRLYEASRERGSLLASVAKDTGARHLRMALAFEIMRSAARVEGGTRGDASEGSREVPRLALRALSYPRSDVSLILEGGFDPGFVGPLSLGCLRPACLQSFKLLEQQGLLPVVRRLWRRTLALLDEQQAKRLQARVARVLIRLRSLPKLSVFYLMPVPGELPLRVEIMQADGGGFYAGTPPEFGPADATHLSLLRALAAAYAGPALYNVWLVAAHRLAKLSRASLRALESALRLMGVRIPPPRRRMLLA